MKYYRVVLISLFNGVSSFLLRHGSSITQDLYEEDKLLVSLFSGQVFYQCNARN